MARGDAWRGVMHGQGEARDDGATRGEGRCMAKRRRVTRGRRDKGATRQATRGEEEARDEGATRGEGEARDEGATRGEEEARGEGATCGEGRCMAKRRRVTRGRHDKGGVAKGRRVARGRRDKGDA